MQHGAVGEFDKRTQDGSIPDESQVGGVPLRRMEFAHCATNRNRLWVTQKVELRVEGMSSDAIAPKTNDGFYRPEFSA